jgi:hypothetical protein
MSDQDDIKDEASIDEEELLSPALQVAFQLTFEIINATSNMINEHTSCYYHCMPHHTSSLSKAGCV